MSNNNNNNSNYNNNNANNNYNINANINISNNITEYVNKNDFDIKDKLFVNVFPNFKKIWKLNMIRTKQFIEFTTDVTIHADNIANKYLKYLSKMNSLGFITIDSQSDLQEIATYPATKDYLKKDPKNETSPHIIKYIGIQQPYINGFIPKKIYSQFVEKLDKISQYCYCIDLVKDDYAIGVTHYYTRYSDNTSDCTPHTTFTKKYLGEGDRDFQIELLYSDYKNSYGGGVEGLEIDKDEWIYVVVLDTRVSYNVEASDGLFVSVINALEESLKQMNQNRQNRNRNLNKTVKNRNNRNNRSNK